MKVVLINPQIPPNTGNIARTCAANNITLVLVGRIGFSLDDKHLKRAGLDYWEYVNLEIYSNFSEFLTKNNINEENLIFLSTKGKKLFWEAPYTKNSVLVFGSETEGFPKDFYTIYQHKLYKIPIKNEKIRSLNLATSCGIVIYEALRQIKINYGDQDE
ncbi:MAG: tRNA (cytidine(34)-2'-O)-methyltransferase [Elusimicrobiales bacterium]|nr:tRNA (cytidine(34)-2'-O)-methyltransferase [Elusimicrobiales bacterium]